MFSFFRISNVLFLCAFLPFTFAYSQTKVAITIDDVPNTALFENNNYHSVLLDVLIANSIAATIFINEGQLYKTPAFEKNLVLLEKWSQCELFTLGNHSFSHSRYSSVGLDSFIVEIDSGAYFTQHFANNYQKSLRFFRFPYNDLGADSIEQAQIDSVLTTRGYLSTPFTIESSDWMFNYVYDYYITHGDSAKAQEIAVLYISKTVELFHFFDALSLEKYGRKIDQIYLCHDNLINRDYLKTIVEQLTHDGYFIATLEEVLEDPAYSQPNHYVKKWGVSWFYRWMTDHEERIKWMKLEPDFTLIEGLYNSLQGIK